MAANTNQSSQQDLAGLDAESRQMVLDTLQVVRDRLLPKAKVLELDKKEEFPEEIIREMLGPEIKELCKNNEYSPDNFYWRFTGKTSVEVTRFFKMGRG